MGTESVEPEGRVCYGCGATAVVVCDKCRRPVCRAHVTERVIPYDPGRPRHMVRFHCGQCLYRHASYVWPIALLCMAATVAIVWLVIVSRWR